MRLHDNQPRVTKGLEWQDYVRAMREMNRRVVDLDRKQRLWSNKFWDAMGCGESEDAAERIANAAVAALR